MKKLLLLLFLLPVMVACEKEENYAISDDVRIFGEWMPEYVKSRLMFIDNTFTPWVIEISYQYNRFKCCYLDDGTYKVFYSKKDSLMYNYEVNGGFVKLFRSDTILLYKNYKIENDSLYLISKEDISNLAFIDGDRIVFDTLKIRESYSVYSRIR